MAAKSKSKSNKTNNSSKSNNKSNTSRPSRDEFELMELAETLNTAMEEKKKMSFMIWKRSEPIKGIVDKLDPSTQRVHIRTVFDGVYKVPFIDILKAVDVE